MKEKIKYEIALAREKPKKGKRLNIEKAFQKNFPEYDEEPHRIFTLDSKNLEVEVLGVIKIQKGIYIIKTSDEKDYIVKVIGVRNNRKQFKSEAHVIIFKKSALHEEKTEKAAYIFDIDQDGMYGFRRVRFKKIIFVEEIYVSNFHNIVTASNEYFGVPIE